MDFDKLKFAYKNAEQATKNKEEIKRMTHVNQHPSLRGMRRQLIIETVCWTVFLFVYYDFFDGHLRPFLWNLLLVVSILLLLVHNMLGYRIALNPINGENIKQSLKNYLLKIKRYSVISISTRVLAIVSLMLFLTSNITFNAYKSAMLAVLALLIAFQIFALHRVWSKRIQKIRRSYEELS